MTVKLSSDSEPLARSGIHVHGRHFVDKYNRVIHLRGANVSGCSKVPSSDPSVDVRQPHLASYVNRPFPLSEAPIHWARLKRWGLNYLRITVTWEAIEHDGPGIYDQDYLTYLRALLESLTEAGLICYVAIHQDVWSRLSGGSGAPAWTMQYAGLSIDPDVLEETGGAWLKGVDESFRKGTEASWGEGLERGLWPTGYQKMVCATMNTLFWAGQTFAPQLIVTDPVTNQLVNIQTFLQDRFQGMFGKLIDALQGVEGVLGYEMMNEPHPGFIGMGNLYGFNYETDLHMGDYPSPLQSFAIAAGHPQKVPHYVRSWPMPSKIEDYRTVNPRGVCLWTRDTANATENKVTTSPCIWAQHGLWAFDTQTQKPVVLKEGYFTKDSQGRKVDFYDNFYWPFVKRWEQLVKSKTAGEKMVHVEGVPNEYCPEWPLDVRPTSHLVFSPHWYDLNALFNKSFGFMTVNVQGLARGMFILKALYFGRRAARRNFTTQIGNIVREGRKRLGEVPIVIGETGVPMDLNKKEAFKTGDYKWQAHMMDCILTAVERNMVGVNLWTYNPLNTDTHGDNWNFENFSWFSQDRRQEALYDRFLSSGAPIAGSKTFGQIGLGPNDADDLDLGGVMLDQVVRPYPLRTAGIPISIDYDPETTLFRFTYRNPSSRHTPESDVMTPPLDGHPLITNPETEIFLPPRFIRAYQPRVKSLKTRAANERDDCPLIVSTSNGITWTIDVTRQVMLLVHDNNTDGAEYWVEIKIQGHEDDSGGEFTRLIVLLLALLVALLAFLLHKHHVFGVGL